ncbi:MAG: ATP synthase subunit I [Cyanobacteria bacterium J06641_5]
MPSEPIADAVPIAEPEGVSVIGEEATSQPLPDAELEVAPTGDSMQEFYQLQRTLFRVTVAVTGIAFISIWVVYSLSIAASYMLGASVGMFYLNRLAKDVATLGSGGGQFGSGRIALFIGLVVVATQLQSLQLLPAIFGFLTYKIAILIYAVQTAILSE